MLKTRKKAIADLIASKCPLNEFSLKEYEAHNTIYDVYKLYLNANDNFYFEFWYSTEAEIDGTVSEHFKYEFSSYENGIVIFPEMIEGDDTTTFEDLMQAVSIWLDTQVSPYLSTVEHHD